MTPYEFERFRVGSRVNFTLLDLLGQPYQKRVTIMGKPFQWGWIDEIGGWSPYSSDSYRPAYFVDVRPYRKRKTRLADLDDILACSEVIL